MNMKENLVYELNEVMRELSVNGQTINTVRHSLDNKLADGINELFGDYTKAEELREKLMYFSRLHTEIYHMIEELQKEVNKYS